jgi:serine protease Do
MRKFILLMATVSSLFLPIICRAEQSWSVDPPANTWVFSSEDYSSGSYLGVDIADVTTDRLDALKLKEEAGVEVTMVDQDAPAGKAGIKEHDVILAMNGTKIESKAQLQRMIHETPPGRTVTLDLSRDGQPVSIKVQLADRRKEFSSWSPKDFHFAMPAVPDVPAIPEIEVPSFVMVHSSVRSGLMVENITPQLGEFFGAKNGNGVLVRSVEKGSRGDKAGLRAGDVIVRVGDQAIHDTSDFSRSLRSRHGDSVQVGVIRDRKEQTLTLTLPPHSDSGEVIEESDTDEIGAATRVQLSALKDQLAQLEPQMRLAAQDLHKAARDHCKAAQATEKQLREQAEKLREQYQPRVQEELQRSLEKLQNEMEKLQRKMDKGLDI